MPSEFHSPERRRAAPSRRKISVTGCPKPPNSTPAAAESAEGLPQKARPGPAQDLRTPGAQALRGRRRPSRRRARTRFEPAAPATPNRTATAIYGVHSGGIHCRLRIVEGAPKRPNARRPHYSPTRITNPIHLGLETITTNRCASAKALGHSLCSTEKRPAGRARNHDEYKEQRNEKNHDAGPSGPLAVGLRGVHGLGVG